MNLFRRNHKQPPAPAPVDGEVEFYEDLRYLESLLDCIVEEAHHNAYQAPHAFEHWVARPLLQMLSIPIESIDFWRTWDWPDEAARLLINWRFEKALGLGPHHISDIA